ncbi:MAG: membrane protein insertase YidC [Polyangiaceae bacterium]
MDRNTILRWIVIASVMLGAYWLFNGRKSSEEVEVVPSETTIDAPGFAPDVIDVRPGQPPVPPPPPGETCTLHGNRYEADLSTRGAGLTHLRLTDARYSHSDAADMSTTPDIERWRNLRTAFREAGTPPSPDDQVQYDRLNWKLETPAAGVAPGASCTFSYEDDRVRIVKAITAGQRPFEMNIDTTLTNLAKSPKRHLTSIEVFAYRTNKEVKGKLGRVSPFQTDVECARDSKVERKRKDDKTFKAPPFWFEEPLVDRYAAVANYYFAQALVPLDVAPGESGPKPACAILAEPWYSAGQKPDDDQAGDVYHARLDYPPRTLAPHESAEYRQIAFFGPKERGVLGKAAGGGPRLQDLINLGTFSIIAKYLVLIITWINGHLTFGNWGLAIIVLTLGLRFTLFPLTWKQIQSSIAMRRLKPEINAINEKFKGDAQAKNLAMMELWRKNKVSPLGGCLPALVQMPIWFALYTTLETAVEFYHTKFLWFSDLSAPDRYFILPFVLGVAMIVQQKVVPQQGMDPMQQKLMTFLMPGVFTVMMLFLPAALGVYMFTNSVLGISQQLAVEKFFPQAGMAASTPPNGSASHGGDLAVSSVNKGAASAAMPRKGKGRA